MDYQEYREDKIHSHRPTESGRSDCCEAPVYGDYLICSDCKEHCDYLPELCGYCGDVEVEEEGEFCSDSCWKGYEHETFRKED